MMTGGQPPPDQYRQEDPRAAGHWSAAKSWMVSWRGSNRLVLVIVAIALLLDNMLLTTVGKLSKILTVYDVPSLYKPAQETRINRINLPWPLAFHGHLSWPSPAKLFIFISILILIPFSVPIPVSGRDVAIKLPQSAT